MAIEFITVTDATGTSRKVLADQIGADTFAQVLKVAYGSDGTLTLAETAAPLPTGVQTMPAADRTTDSIAAALQTDAVMNGATPLTPKFAKITASSSGATTIVSAVTSKKLRVLAWTLACNAAVNVKWQSHVTPTDLTGLYYFAANGGISVPFSPVGWFETVAGEALDINLSGAFAVGGQLVYAEV